MTILDFWKKWIFVLNSGFSCKSLPFFYFLIFEKGRLPYIHLVGRSVGWSVGWLTSPLIFFNIYRHKSPLLTQYHSIPISTKLYWPSTTKLQTVSPHTDPVSSNTNQYCPVKTQYYHISWCPLQWCPLIIIQKRDLHCLLGLVPQIFTPSLSWLSLSVLSSLEPCVLKLSQSCL